jgi:hypothetical protein
MTLPGRNAAADSSLAHRPGRVGPRRAGAAARAVARIVGRPRSGTNRRTFGVNAGN